MGRFSDEEATALLWAAVFLTGGLTVMKYVYDSLETVHSLYSNWETAVLQSFSGLLLIANGLGACVAYFNAPPLESSKDREQE